MPLLCKNIRTNEGRIEKKSATERDRKVKKIKNFTEINKEIKKERQREKEREQRVEKKSQIERKKKK